MPDEFPPDMLQNPKDRDPGPEYSPFNPELDEKYPIETMLSQENMNDVVGGLPDLNWIRILSNSPAKNAEAEILMGQMVTLSARAGQWVDLPPMPDEETEGGTITIGDIEIELPGVRLNFSTEGKKALEEVDFVKAVHDDDGHEMLKPKEPMMKFFKERLQERYGPEEIRKKK